MEGGVLQWSIDVDCGQKYDMAMYWSRTLNLAVCIVATSLLYIVERLDILAKQASLQFVVADSLRTDVRIGSDAFCVRLLLSATGDVKDVQVYHGIGARDLHAPHVNELRVSEITWSFFAVHQCFLVLSGHCKYTCLVLLTNHWSEIGYLLVIGYLLAALKFCFKTCVTMKFVDDDDDDLAHVMCYAFWCCAVMFLQHLSLTLKAVLVFLDGHISTWYPLCEKYWLTMQQMLSGESISLTYGQPLTHSVSRSKCFDELN